MNNIKIFNGFEKNLGDSYEIYNNIKQNIQKLKSFEAPNLYIELDDKVIGIEYFEFCSYKTNRKGNSIKRKLEEIDKENHEDFINKKMIIL